VLSEPRWSAVPATVLLAAVLVGACEQRPPTKAERTLRFTGATMGTTYQVRAVFGDAVDEARVRAAVEAELAAVSARASTWDPQSELSRFNAHASSDPFPVSPELAALVEESLEVARETEGAFDPTVLPLVRMLGFSGDGTPPSLDPAELSAAREHVGFDMLRVDGHRLVKLDPALEVDLSGLAPGDAVDRLGAVLESLGATYSLVDIGGEVRAFGHPPDKREFVIGVESPSDTGELLGTLGLARGAVSTSGDYRRFHEVNGRRVHHIVDPRTGANPTHDLASVTVLAPTCARADALATALLVLGAQDGLAFVERAQDVEALFVRRAADGALTIEASAGFPDLDAPK
jgi:FAD:protein FMN transferase